jgi:hypothetical protein
MPATCAFCGTNGKLAGEHALGLDIASRYFATHPRMAL